MSFLDDNNWQLAFVVGGYVMLIGDEGQLSMIVSVGMFSAFLSIQMMKIQRIEKKLQAAEVFIRSKAVKVLEVIGNSSYRMRERVEKVSDELEDLADLIKRR